MFYYVSPKISKRINYRTLSQTSHRLLFNNSNSYNQRFGFESNRNSDNDLKKNLDKSQKEFILREKIRLIKEELGDISSKDDDIEELKNKINKLKAPKNIIKKLNRELKKYESTPSVSPEVGIIRNYLDVMINLPWNTYTKDNTDLKEVKND